MIPSILRPFFAAMVRPKALIIPVVKVNLNPKGFPSANTFWPTTMSLELENARYS